MKWALARIASNLRTSSLKTLYACTTRPNMETMNTGTKRKRDHKSATKFYAVRTGRAPGVYYAWPDCFEQIRGFPNASFQSFTTLSEAESFVAGGPSAGGEAKVTKWYAVQAGRTPGVYTSWQDVLDQITGWKGAKQKAFKSKAEAERFVAETSLGPITSVDVPARSGDAVEPPVKKSKSVKSRKSTGSKDEESTTPVIEQGEYEPGEAPLLEDVEDGFDPSIVLDPAAQQLRYRSRAEREQTVYRAARPVEDAPIRIYTDGSALGNGRDTAIAGVGVYFGPGDKRNLSEPLTGTRQTNQRAELTAVVRALEMAPKDRRIVIVTDSQYAINCSTDWFRNWQGNGWVNKARKPVENKDLVQKIIDLLEERIRLNRHRAATESVGEHTAESDPAKSQRAYWNRGPGGVVFEWVKGHDKDENNNAADQLAVAGSHLAQELNGEVDLDE